MIGLNFQRSRLGILLIVGILAAGGACKSEDQDRGLSGQYVGTQVFGIGQVSSPYILILSQRGQSITGTVTPPFSTAAVQITNVESDGRTFLRFNRREGNVTYHYRSAVRLTGEGGIIISGELNPLGCINPSSGEPCLTDSNGSFTATRQ